MLNRFATIFWHYVGGALFGFRQRLWPQEKIYSWWWRLAALILFVGQLCVLLFAGLPPVPRVGLALILFSPQWLYVYPIPYPVFEFRGYGMAAGVTLLTFTAISYSMKYSCVAVIALAVCWAWRSRARRHILVDPLRFWARAEEEHHGP
jgi:hypothetical protein